MYCEDPIKHLISITGAIGLIILLGVFIACVGGAFDGQTVEKIDTYSLYALEDNRDIHGRFFVGSGRIDQDLFYYFMTVQDEGKHIEKAQANLCYIDETDEAKPYVEVYRKEITKPHSLSLRPGILSDKGPYKYVFHIPEGSVASDYSVDMK